MASFRPTPNQQRVIDAGNRWFAESRKPGTPAYSKRFVDKCTSEMGINPKAAHRQSKISAVLARLFGHESWLHRLMHPKLH